MTPKDRPLAPTDRDDLRALFAAWPHHRDLHRALRLDPARVAHHLADRALGHPARLLRDAGYLRALLTLRDIPWLTDHLSHPVARVEHLHGAPLAPLLDRPLPTLTLARAPAADLPALHALADRGFRLVAAELTGVIRLDAPPTDDGPFEVAPLTPQDLDAAAALAARGHPHSAFAHDPRIGPHTAGRLYAAQLRSRPHDPDSHVLAARHRGHLAGFIVARVIHHPAAAAPLGNLDFIAVDPDHRHRGLGDHLNRAALAALHARGVTAVTVRTLATNTAALATLRRLDWRIAAADLVHHHWSEP